MMGFGSYETAHSMCHKIRAALIEPEAKLGGIVEVDETCIGGKANNKHGQASSGGARRHWSGKTPSSVQSSARATSWRAFSTACTRKPLTWFVRETVSNKVSLLATDEARVYAQLGTATYPHAIRQPRDRPIRCRRDPYATRLKASGRSSSAASSAAFHKVSAQVSAAVRCGVSVPLQQSAATPTSSVRP